MVDNKTEPAEGAGAVPAEPRASVDSDLQYVSIEMDGSTYGGWYRVLPDGQMELLALANMHCELRSEATPVEQARGMLTDFIRGMRRKSRGNTPRGNTPHGNTLGALLYADTNQSRVAEQEWVALTRSIAAGDGSALRDLYERCHRIVFTLLMRLTHNVSAAELLTVDVFREIWARAYEYEAADGPVLAWVMSHARSRGIEHWGADWGRRAIAREQDVQSHWPADVLTPAQSLWSRVVARLAIPVSVADAPEPWLEPEWEDAAPGISVKLLANDAEKHRVSMLVRLAPGTDYPPHTHAGLEELHLLQGELRIETRMLRAGDYNRAEPGSSDKRVWSETGCMCVLMTSTQDSLG